MVSLEALHIFESFLSSLDLLDYNKLAVITETPYTDLLVDSLINKGYTMVRVKEDSKDLLKFIRPNTYLISRSYSLVQPYSAWMSYLDRGDVLMREITLFSSLITEEVSELFLLFKVRAEDFFLAYRVLEEFRGFRGGGGRVEALILIEDDLSLIDRFNLVTFLARALTERLITRVHIFRLDRLRRYLHPNVLDDLLKWGLRIYSEYIGKDILLTDTREVRHIYFVSLLDISDASLLIKNLAGASQLAKFLTWGIVFTSSMGYAHLKGNEELLNQVNISDLVKACGWMVHKIVNPVFTATDHVQLFLAESSEELLRTLSSDIWNVTSLLSEEERSLKVLLPFMKLTREFVSEIMRGPG